ncbi:MAG: tRNA (adenosine(37)-N6)-dimethylallyltransferase MiaA [Gemmatimonadota bacterium]|jgi:tRNA dimethylallyltransferase
MKSAAFNTLVILGPTASGKTHLGVALAAELGGEILSVDSRQVYRGLDIGSGKDLAEYSVDGRAIPYHLIDIVDLDTEYNTYMYQRDFYAVFERLTSRATLPVAVGGTGLYLDAVLQRFRMVETPENGDLRRELGSYSDDELAVALRSLKPKLHNTTDLTERARMIRAIEIALCARDHPPPRAPDIRPLVLGTRWERSELRARIRQRLKDRLAQGLIEEVEHLLDRGVGSKRLHSLGLEYRYVSDYLGGTIKSRNDLTQKLASAIAQYAKRQETWFRRMERNGTEIHWIGRGDLDAAMAVCHERGREWGR